MGTFVQYCTGSFVEALALQRRHAWRVVQCLDHLGGGNSNIFLCSPLFGEDELILTFIFFKGVVQPPTSHVFFSFSLSDPQELI